MSEVSKIVRGAAITENDATPGQVPVVTNGPVPIYPHSVENRTGETIVVAPPGTYAGLPSYWNKPIFLTDAFNVDPDPAILAPKLVYYSLQNSQKLIHSTKERTGVPHVRIKEVEGYLIPIPPPAE